MSDEEEVNLEELHKELRFAFKEIQGSSAFSLDRDRPYDGRPHTGCGTRGKTLVSGLTMRDVSDCIVRGFLAASALDRREAGIPEHENPCLDDIYQIDLAKIDPGAVIQCAMCEVEKMMGIFPNVPKLIAK
jgi:hypothetical protein